MKTQGLKNVFLIFICSGLIDLSCQSRTSPDTAELDNASVRHPRRPTQIAAAAPDTAERAKISASGKFLAEKENLTAFAQATPLEMAAALDLPEGTVRNAAFSGSSTAGEVLTELGIINIPQDGMLDSFVYLSTGTVGSLPEPGTDFLPAGSEGDMATLRVDVAVPSDTYHLSFDYLFLSAESPEWTNSVYNDMFKVRISDSRGVREKVIASVNSSYFFAASDSRADRTNFDIFTANPSDVDSDFEGGLPDAGLTSFQTGVIDVADNETVTLEFIVHDTGDGILDSAVIINNVHFTVLETLDPNPSLLTSRGSVTQDTAELVGGGQNVSGVVADGVTPVLIRMETPSAGLVDFSIAGVDPNNPTLEDGGFKRLGSTTDAEPVLQGVETVTDEASGRHYALCLYLAPDDFCRPGNPLDPTLGQRPVTLQSDFVANEGRGTVHGEQALNILRPPLILVHGIWSSPEDWRLKLDTDDASLLTCEDYHDTTETRMFNLACADYSMSQGASFDENVPVVAQTIRGTLTELRQRHIAVTQADVIAHCTGGLLLRKYIAREGNPDLTENYKTPQNFFAGDVNRLITLNTPHTGSMVAQYLAETRDQLTGTDQLAEFIGSLYKPAYGYNITVDQGGLDDLLPHSMALTSIPETQVPSHAFVGSGGLALRRITALGAAGTRTVMYAAIETWHQNKPLVFTDTGVSDVFSEEHDIFVGVGSQQGGIADEATTVITSKAIPRDLWATHYQAYWSERYSDSILELLNSPATADDPRYAYFPAVSPVVEGVAAARYSSAMAFEPSTDNVLASPVEGGLYIASPLDGSDVSPGSTVTVHIEAQNGFSPALMYVLTKGDIVLFEEPPFETEFVIPENAIGTIPFVAYGYGADGNYAKSNEVVLNVTSPAPITEIRIVNRDPVLSGFGTRRQVKVRGLFDDGIERDITAASLGTVYLSSDPSILGVTSDGVLTALGHGVVTLVAINSDLQNSVSVTVIDDDDGDGIPGQTDNCPWFLNPQQEDTDDDGLGDACDACPLDPLDDIDADGVCGSVDNCLESYNPEQLDSDQDGAGDACDACPLDPLDDIDADGICGDVDNCPESYNPNQLDSDQDGAGDACDVCLLDPLDDIDADGVCGDVDNCPENDNPDQLDSDQDDAGDACDVCLLDPLDDIDADGVCGDVDNCPEDYNPDQIDSDDDTRGDVCDVCPFDPLDDIDADSVCGDVDNCLEDYNPDQSDSDDDGVGDLCDMVITTGTQHTCALLESGGIKCWGDDHYGQLGDDSYNDSQNQPVDVVGLGGRVLTLDAGGWHTCALLDTGAVQCWGRNLMGQLGDGSITISRDQPVDVIGLNSGVKAIAAGGAHTCAVMLDGGVKCWGLNLVGQLGIRTRHLSQPTPVAVVGLDGPAKTVRAGDEHTCALLESGKVQCWGKNLLGQLGDGGMPTNQNHPVNVVGLAAGIRNITLGGAHSCAQLESGAAMCWGANTKGQLGHGIFDTAYDTPLEVVGLSGKVTAISAGGEHTCIQLESGISQCFGADTFDQLGDGIYQQNQNTPVDVVGLHEGVREISAGGWHTCALIGPGILQCWGAGSVGQLGNGENNDYGIPVEVIGL